MVNYANGVETRSIIVDTCKKLFMEKGYKNTTYSEIYKAAMVNPGTIAHHFGNKRNIASMLYDEFMKKLTEMAFTMFADEDDMQKAFLGLGLHRKLINDNEAYRRFVMEFMLDDLANDDESKYLDTSYAAYRAAADRVGRDKADFLFVAYKGIEAAVDAYFSRHPEKQSFEQNYTFYLEMYFGYLPNEEVAERAKKAVETLSKIKLDIVDFEPVIVE